MKNISTIPAVPHEKASSVSSGRQNKMPVRTVPYCNEHRVCAATGSPNPAADAERGAAPVTPLERKDVYR